MGVYEDQKKILVGADNSFNAIFRYFNRFYARQCHCTIHLHLILNPIYDYSRHIGLLP